MFAPAKLSMIAVFAALPLAPVDASGQSSSKQVRTDDINLASEQGQKILALRISRAAREVCDVADDRLDLKIRKIERKCRDAAIASAWANAKINRRLTSR